MNDGSKEIKVGSATKPTLLVVDDDAGFRNSLSRGLRDKFNVVSAGSPGEASHKMLSPPDIVLLDLRFSDDNDDQTGLELLETFTKQYPEIPVIMATGFGDVKIAVEAMRRGAADFIQKADLKISELTTRLERALDTNLLKRKIEQLERELKLVEPRQIIGTSPVMERIRRVVEAAARDGHISVLIRGETGTGKELIARAIHASGWRKSAPFVSVMLNALPPTTLEDELFGHEAGAFTDAREKRIGYLEKSRGGVLFLDEIGEVGLDIQVKLLRFLEEREFQRLGSTKSIKLDTQVLAATNADLERRVSEGKFREDLYFRLKVHEVVVPPLRARAEDVPLLVSHLLQVFRQRGKGIYEISPSALQKIVNHPFPGNVRQLRNIIESSLFNAELHGNRQIEIEDLPQEIMDASNRFSASDEAIDRQEFSILETLARAELEYVEKALTRTQGKKTEAWRLLGYHDRFVFSRRVQRIFENFESLRNEFPSVYKNFKGKTTRTQKDFPEN